MFSTAAECQRIGAFISRVIRAASCDENLPAMSDLVEDSDDAVFEWTIEETNIIFCIIFS